jgi:hypothetical protein
MNYIAPDVGRKKWIALVLAARGYDAGHVVLQRRLRYGRAISASIRILMKLRLSSSDRQGTKLGPTDTKLRRVVEERLAFYQPPF